MKVPEYRRFNRSETGPLPPAVEQALDHLQKQIEVLTQAITRLDFWGNFLADVRVVRMTHNTPTRFQTSRLQVPPSGALVLWSTKAVVGFQCVRVDQSTVETTVLFSGAPTEPGDVTIAILGRSTD